ncbi:MAG: lipase family protein, partial [Candidatus Amoebophilus sp.]
AFFQTTGAVLAVSEAMPIALLGAVASISVYYSRKKIWRNEVIKHFIEREAGRIKLELYDFAIELKKLNRDIFRIKLLKNGNFLERINSTPLGISEIEKTAGLLDCIYGISDNDRNGCKPLLSQTIWNDVFSRVNEHIVKRFFQTPYDFYENVSAPDQMEQIPPSYVKYLMEKIKNNNKLSHIPEEFINNLLTNCLKEPDTLQAFSLTGSYLPPKRLKKFINFITFCRHIYTDITTRDFVVTHMIPTYKAEWKRIINNKNEIDRLHSELLKLREDWSAVSRQPATYEKRGKYLSSQTLAIDREKQRPKFQQHYTYCVDQINIFLQNILNRDPINHKNIKDIVLAEQELNEVQQEIHMEFYSHFNDKQIDASIPCFIDTTDKNKKYPLKAEGVIAASFLHKTQLPISNENISILNVGFRNLEGVKSIFSSILKPLIVYKDNPLACFTERNEEVDYIAYVEKDKSLKQKDKLVIVYSGSNSSKDWNANITLGSTSVRNLAVHQGIGDLFTKSASTYCNLLIDKINHYYENNPKPKKFKIITTGHSLGGALALLAAYHYKTEQIPHLYDKLDIDENSISVKTFIFGAPAIADKSSQKNIEKVLGENNIFRIWTIDDPVVHLSKKLKWHVGTSFPLCNISNNKFNFLDLWGPHLAERYLGYLQALQQPFVSETHKELSSILKETKILEMITMLRDGSLRTELPRSGEISIKADITSEGAGSSLSQNFEGTTTSNLPVSSSEREQEISQPEV